MSLQSSSQQPQVKEGTSLTFAWLRRTLLSEYFVLYLIIAYFIVLLFFVQGLGRPQNISNIFANTWPLFVVAIGQTFVLIIAGIDLSQGAVIGLSSVFGAAIMATRGLVKKYFLGKLYHRARWFVGK
jgi:ribose/xylose/arabinose/galactoside ABC-type transport system permease subunit